MELPVVMVILVLFFEELPYYFFYSGYIILHSHQQCTVSLYSHQYMYRKLFKRELGVIIIIVATNKLELIVC